jgi:hypothetical protein
VAALVPMVVSQIVRLEQSDPATWISWDYAGRVGALAVLGAIASARTCSLPVGATPNDVQPLWPAVLGHYLTDIVDFAL